MFLKKRSHDNHMASLRCLLPLWITFNAVACGVGREGASLSFQEHPPAAGVEVVDDAVSIPEAVDETPRENIPPGPPGNPLVPNPNGVQLSEVEAKAIELTNVERQRHGLAPLAVSPRLQENCRSWAGTMARQRRMYHSNMNFSGENVAWGHPTPEAVIRGWMNSPGHRANILTGSFRTIGLGVASAYWCQQFGR